MSKLTADELNAMSGLELVCYLWDFPEPERKALIAQLDEAATRRYVHANIAALFRDAAWRAGKWMIAVAAVTAGFTALYFAVKGLRSLLLAAIG